MRCNEGDKVKADSPTFVEYMYLPESICAGVPWGVPCLASCFTTALLSCLGGAAEAVMPFCAAGGGAACAASSFTTCSHKPSIGQGLLSCKEKIPQLCLYTAAHICKLEGKGMHWVWLAIRHIGIHLVRGKPPIARDLSNK